jgi:hypothetical protein
MEHPAPAAVWLPVIAGLASSAVTYFLTREKK